MNRRSFLSGLAAAATGAGAAAEFATVTIIGVDAGTAGDLTTIATTRQNLRTFELEFIEVRTFSVEEIARFYRVPPDQIGRLA